MFTKHDNTGMILCCVKLEVPRHHMVHYPSSKINAFVTTSFGHTIKRGAPPSHLYLQGWHTRNHDQCIVYIYSPIIKHNAIASIYCNIGHGAHSRNYALKPLCRELQGLAGILTHACAEASATCSLLMPALQKFAKDLMCFIPY